MDTTSIAGGDPEPTVVGTPGSRFTEQITVDEATGEQLVLHADSLDELDAVAERVLGDPEH